MDIVKLAKEATTVPSDFGWYGREEMFVTWGFTGISKHRDSQLIDQSNYRSILKFLVDEYGEEFDEKFQDISMGHWAVGHVDTLIVKVYQNVKCEVCGNDIDFIEDEENMYAWSTDDKNSVCNKSLTFEQYHIPAEFDEDNITPEFVKCMEIVGDLRNYAIFDEHDFSELEHEETIKMIAMYWPSECRSEEMSEYKVVDWLSENDCYPDEYADDGTPCYSSEELMLAMFHCGYDDYSDEENQEYWSEWRKNNPSEVVRRKNKRDEDAGQLVMEV